MADFLSMLKSGVSQPKTVEEFQALTSEILANEDLIKQAGNVSPINVAKSFASELASYAGQDLTTVIDQQGGQDFTIADKLASAFSSMKFDRVQERLSSKMADIEEKVKSYKANVANVLADGKNTPEQLAAVEKLKEQYADYISSAESLGIEVPDPVSTSTGYMPASEAFNGTKPGQTGTIIKLQKDANGKYTLIDELTGQQYIDPSGQATSGLTLEEADKLSNMLQSGGTADAVQTVATATGTEPGNTLLETVEATNGDFKANKEFVNGAFQAYLGRDATQGELDTYVGQTVEAIRNALKTGANGIGMTEDVDPELPDEFDSDFLNDAISASITDSDISALLTQMQTQQQELLALLAPTEEETDLKEQLIDLKTSYDLGLAEIEDQPIAMGFITGQQASLERRAVALEANLLMKLGLAQDERKAALQAAEIGLGFTQTNIDTYFKMQEIAFAQEQALFNKIMALKQDARDTLTMMLETLQGVDPAQLTSDQVSSLQSLADSAGVPYSLLEAGLDNIYTQSQIDEVGSLTLGEIYDTAQKLYDSGVYDSFADAYNAVSQGTVGLEDTGDWTEWLSVTGLGTITQSYDTDHNGKSGWHAIDIDGEIGDAIYSPISGTIVESVSDQDSATSGWGNKVVIEDSDGNQWLMAHFSNVAIEVGSTVSAGQLIGTMGATGEVYAGAGNNGSHLHLQVRDLSGNYLDPRTLMVSTEETSDLSDYAKSAMAIFSVGLSSTAAKAANQALKDAIKSGSSQAIQETILSTSINALPSAESKNFAIGRQEALNALGSIESALSEYISAGGDTGLISGNLEKIQERVLKSTDDPELAKIATQIVVSIQAYRKAVSGAAFTESEQKEYQSVFPDVANTPELNQAKIDALRSIFQSNQRSTLGTIMGYSNYDAIFPTVPDSVQTEYGTLTRSKVIDAISKRVSRTDALKYADDMMILLGEGYSFDEVLNELNKLL